MNSTRLNQTYAKAPDGFPMSLDGSKVELITTRTKLQTVFTNVQLFLSAWQVYVSAVYPVQLPRSSSLQACSTRQVLQAAPNKRIGTRAIHPLIIHIDGHWKQRLYNIVANASHATKWKFSLILQHFGFNTFFSFYHCPPPDAIPVHGQLILDWIDSFMFGRDESIWMVRWIEKGI